MNTLGVKRMSLFSIDVHRTLNMIIRLLTYTGNVLLLPLTQECSRMKSQEESGMWFSHAFS